MLWLHITGRWKMKSLLLLIGLILLPQSVLWKEDILITVLRPVEKSQLCSVYFAISTVCTQAVWKTLLSGGATRKRSASRKINMEIFNTISWVSDIFSSTQFSKNSSETDCLLLFVLQQIVYRFLITTRDEMTKTFVQIEYWHSWRVLCNADM